MYEIDEYEKDPDSAPRGSLTEFVTHVAKRRTASRPHARATLHGDYALLLMSSLARSAGAVIAPPGKTSNEPWPDGYLGTLFGVALWVDDAQRQDIVFDDAP